MLPIKKLLCADREKRSGEIKASSNQPLPEFTCPR